MSTLVKTFFAFVLGFGAIYGTQFLGFMSVSQYLRSDTARLKTGLPEMKPITTNFDKMGTFTMPKMAPIDTRAAQAAGVMANQRRIDMEIRRAQDYARPRGIPGMR
jgi:hypothetical protein